MQRLLAQQKQDSERESQTTHINGRGGGDRAKGNAKRALIRTSSSSTSTATTKTTSKIRKKSAKTARQREEEVDEQKTAMTYHVEETYPNLDEDGLVAQPSLKHLLHSSIVTRTHSFQAYLTRVPAITTDHVFRHFNTLSQASTNRMEKKVRHSSSFPSTHEHTRTLRLLITTSHALKVYTAPHAKMRKNARERTRAHVPRGSGVFNSRKLYHCS